MQRVLIVDDDPGVLALMRRHIERVFHCQVDAASTFDEARRMLQSRPYDVLVTDYALEGGQSGIGLLSEAGSLRNDHDSSNPAGSPLSAAILITGLDDPAIDEHARRAGFASCVVKDHTFLEHLTAAVDVIGILPYRSRHS